jgi:hypothetical protein
MQKAGFLSMPRIMGFPFPPKLKMPHIEAYNGNKNPLDHLETYKALMHLQDVTNEIIC